MHEIRFSPKLASFRNKFYVSEVGGLEFPTCPTRRLRPCQGEGGWDRHQVNGYYSCTFPRVKIISRLQFHLNTTHMTPVWIKAFRLSTGTTQSETFSVSAQLIREAFGERWSLDAWVEYLFDTPMGGGLCPLNPCRFFRKVIGFHNWVYFAFLESRREVNYQPRRQYTPKWHTKDGKVSYNLHQGDQRKCSLSFFIIIKWGHKWAREREMPLTREKQAL